MPPVERTVLRNGVVIPLLGYAASAIHDPVEAYDAVSIALAAGYRSVQTAPEHGNESAVGHAIADSGLPRSAVFVATAVALDVRSECEVVTGVERSLEALRTGWLDLVVMPSRRSVADRGRILSDGLAWRVLEGFYGERDIRALGVAGFDGWALGAFAGHREIPPHLVRLRGDEERQRAAIQVSDARGMLVELHGESATEPLEARVRRDPRVLTSCA